MPTPKQVRFHYKKVYNLVRRLQYALTDAHSDKVLMYPPDQFKEQSPCYTMYEVERRIEATMEKQLADAMRKEIRSQK